MSVTTRERIPLKGTQKAKRARQLKQIRKVAMYPCCHTLEDIHTCPQLHYDVAKPLYYMGGLPFIHCLLINDNSEGKNSFRRAHCPVPQPGYFATLIEAAGSFAQVKLMTAFLADVTSLTKSYVVSFV